MIYRRTESSIKQLAESERTLAVAIALNDAPIPRLGTTVLRKSIKKSNFQILKLKKKLSNFMKYRLLL